MQNIADSSKEHAKYSHQQLNLQTNCSTNLPSTSSSHGP